MTQVEHIHHGNQYMKVAALPTLQTWDMSGSSSSLLRDKSLEE